MQSVYFTNAGRLFPIHLHCRILVICLSFAIADFFFKAESSLKQKSRSAPKLLYKIIQ